MEIKQYYSLNWQENTKEPVASAFVPEGTKLAQDLIIELDGMNSLPFELTLVKLDVDKNGLKQSNDLSDLKETWVDYQPNSLAWPLMSERLKSIIENNLSGNEQIDWISCEVKSNNEKRPYFVLRFNNKFDVLDKEKTMFVQGTDHIIKPVFVIAKINCYSVFTKPASYDLWKITPNIYISEILKKAIRKQKLTGLDFKKISTV